MEDRFREMGNLLLFLISLGKRDGGFGEGFKGNLRRKMEEGWDENGTYQFLCREGFRYMCSREKGEE